MWCLMRFGRVMLEYLYNTSCGIANFHLKNTFNPIDNCACIAFVFGYILLMSLKWKKIIKLLFRVLFDLHESIAHASRWIKLMPARIDRIGSDRIGCCLFFLSFCFIHGDVNHFICNWKNYYRWKLLHAVLCERVCKQR